MAHPARLLMKRTCLLRLILPALVLMTGACANYATVRKPRIQHESDTASGRTIAAALRDRKATPEAKLGAYLDAAKQAAAVLKRNPRDAQARADYNFAVSRIMEVIHDAGMDPEAKPIRGLGPRGDGSLAVLKPKPPVVGKFVDYRITPADRYIFRGRLVTQRTLKEGLGAPLVVTSRGSNPVLKDPFAQGKSIYYGLTAVISFEGNRSEVRLLDPLAQENVNLDGNTYPLAADFTAPIGMALVELAPRKQEIKRLVKPEEFRASTRLARLQPYDPKKIPILLVHGLGDSQATWAPMVEALRGDATIRQNYQIWFYSYPTGYPYPFTAKILREQMDAIHDRYPDRKKMVLIGHSMGGMIARTLITDTGLQLWNTVFETPPHRTPLSSETRDLVTGALILKHRPEIARVIFCSASLRGSDLATGFLGRLGASIIGTPSDLAEPGNEFVSFAKPGPDGARLREVPNSVQMLDPKNRFTNAINAIPVTPGIPYHSIIGDRGKGGNLDRTRPQSTDGIVPYWSSHIEGAESELIVPSGHWSNRHPMAIAEVRRILVQHLRETKR
jgi:pimeloyl-ACP methyl ester carboxylesterase